MSFISLITTQVEVSTRISSENFYFALGLAREGQGYQRLVIS